MLQRYDPLMSLPRQLGLHHNCDFRSFSSLVTQHSCSTYHLIQRYIVTTVETSSSSLRNTRLICRFHRFYMPSGMFINLSGIESSYAITKWYLPTAPTSSSSILERFLVILNTYFRINSLLFNLLWRGSVGD